MAKEKMRISIKNKILLSFYIIIFVLLFSQIIFNLFFAEKAYIEYNSQVMETAFTELAQSYDGSIDSIEVAAAQYEENHNMSIVINGSNGVKYVTFDRIFNDMNMMDVMAKLNPIIDLGDVAYSYEPTVQIIQRHEQDVPNLLIMGSFDYEGERLDITISLPMASIEQSVDVFSRSTTVISLFVLLITTVVSAYISRTISKPITDIEKVASSLETLDFSQKANEDVTSIELHSLSKSINSMSKKLEQSIEELNLANEKLQADIDVQKKVDDMRKQFVANVSHEMKTPLALLQMYAENLKMNIDGLDKDYYLDTIIEESENLNNMVVSMLDISQIESGLSQMQMEDFSLSELVKSVTAKIEVLLQDVVIEAEIEDGIEILGDRKYLEQAMKNLLTNAGEHTPKDCKIQVSLKRAGKRAVFTVHNDGSHIADEDIESIWQSFYRSDKARVRHSKNVGLGLHITKTIVEKHNGKCEVKNTETGVEFKLTL